MLNIVKCTNHPLTNTITIPSSIFDIDGVINFGTAGGLQDDLKVLEND